MPSKEGKAVRKRNQRWGWCPPLLGLQSLFLTQTLCSAVCSIQCLMPHYWTTTQAHKVAANLWHNYHFHCNLVPLPVTFAPIYRSPYPAIMHTSEHSFLLASSYSIPCTVHCTLLHDFCALACLSSPHNVQHLFIHSPVLPAQPLPVPSTLSVTSVVKNIHDCTAIVTQNWCTSHGLKN